MPIHRLSPLTLSCVLAACPPWPEWEDCSASGCDPSSTSTTGAPAPTTSNPTEGVQTVTGDDPASTSTPGASSSTGDPVDLPPSIVSVELTPNPITYNGPITVSVAAENADGVRMLLESGAVLELDLVAPGVFGGEIAVNTGLDNGEKHVAELTPWRAGIDGEAVDAYYTIALPQPGSEAYWETGNVLGPGQIEAMGVLPGGDVIELGTLFTNNGARCYLRRHDKGGAWKMSDVVSIFPDDGCAAIDLKIDAQGVMFVVVNRQVGNETRWWLTRIPAWQTEPVIIDKGDAGDTAVALAAHPSGAVAVCGFAPSPKLDDDAKAWIFRPNQPGEMRAFDYRPDVKKLHTFQERTRDCVFVGSTLALVGEVNGYHGLEDTTRDRLFILTDKIDAQTSATWNVPSPFLKIQNGAQAVDVDDLGRLVIGGFACDDDCQPEGELRVYDLKTDLGSLTPLGSFPTKKLGVQDVAWSPAGYAVVATGGMKGAETSFTVRAFAPAKVEPVWTFTRKDGGVLHLARALAIGEYGEVYAGGIGENSYPALAYIGG